MQELTKENFLKEAKELKADVLFNSSKYDFKCLSKDGLSKDFNYFEEKIHKNIQKFFKQTKQNAEKIVLSPENNNIYILNPDYMLTLMRRRSLILTDKSNIQLVSLYYNSEKDYFSLSSNGFSCSIFTNKNVTKNEIKYYVNNDNEHHSIITLKKDNLTIESSKTNVTSIQFNKKSILVKFENLYYSSILFDNEFNIKVIIFSDDLKENLAIEKTLKFKNVSYSGGLLGNVKKILKSNLDLYSLVHDKNYIFEHSGITFEMELAYIKNIVSKKTDLLGFYTKHEDSINQIKDYYQDTMYKQDELRSRLVNYIGKQYNHASIVWDLIGLENISISDYTLSKESFEKIMSLSFLSLIKQQNKPIIYPELANIVDMLSNDISKITSLEETTKKHLKKNKVKKC